MTSCHVFQIYPIISFLERNISMNEPNDAEEKFLLRKFKQIFLNCT